MLLPLKAVISQKIRKDGKSVIFYQYCFSSTNRVLLCTEIAVPKSYWNPKRQCISKVLPGEMGDSEELNLVLGRIKKAIEAIIEHGLISGETNIGAYVKGVYTPDFKVETLQHTTNVIQIRKREVDFFTEIDAYNKSKEKKVCEKGFANFRIFKDRLLAFQTFRKRKITFASLDYTFYLELVEFFTYDYLLKRKLNPEYGLKLSSIGKTINMLRVFIKDRVRRKIISPIDMEDFKILDEETDAIYLTYEEIGKIYNLDLTNDPTLVLYRDMFVFGCLTGLRFSDYSTLRGTDLRNGLLYKKANKTDSWVVIPLRKEAVDIFNGHFIGSTPVISNAVFNRYIKEIAERAGISQSITFSYKKGNKDMSTTRPKSHWITSHTCRRSFCTNEYLAGTEISLIMKISGHKTHKDFFKYIRVTQEEAARKIQDIWTARNNMLAFPLKATA
jgi:integrase